MLYAGTSHFKHSRSNNKNSPVLFLGDAATNTIFHEIAEQLDRTGANSILTESSLIECERAPRHEAALGVWSRVGSEYHSACVGLVATTLQSIAETCHLLVEAWEDGRLPGAVVLLGYDTQFAETCLRLSSQSLGSNAEDYMPPNEWPSILIFLPADDPSVAVCASDCRKMRSVGIPVRLEIVGSSLDVTSAKSVATLTSELVSELGSFFKENLAPAFPKMC